MITKLEDGRWRCRTDAGYDHNGRRIQKQRTFRTKAEAEKWERNLKMHQGEASSYRVADYFDDVYYPYVSEHTRPNTHKRYRCDFDRLIRKPLGGCRLEKVTPYMVQSLIDGLETYGAKRNAYVLLRQMYRKAVAWRMVSSVPTDGCELPKHRRKPIEVIPAGKMGDYLEAVRQYAPDILAGVCVSMMGARRSEVCALEWSDVSLGDPVTVHIHGSLVAFAGETVVSDTKTEHSERTIVMPQVLGEILRECAGEGRVVEVCPDQFSKRWRRAIEQAGLPYVALKNVRHSVGTALVESGTPIQAVQDLLGHDLVTTTSRFYLQKTESSFTVSAEVMTSLLVHKNSHDF